jgi:hypothetical protein
MKRSLIVIAAVTVAGLIFGGFSLVGHSGTAKASPTSVALVSIPGAPDSGVTGTVTFMDVGGGVVMAQEIANGITPFEPNNVIVSYFIGKDCQLADTAAVGIWHPGALDQQGFLTNGVQLGTLTPPGSATSDVLIVPATLSPYTGGAASIQSVEINTLPGYVAGSQYTFYARIQHLACANVDGTPVSSA